MNATEVVGLCVVLFWVGVVALPVWCVLARLGVRSKLMATGAILLTGWSLLGLVGWKLADYYTGAGINLAALFHLPMGLTGLSWSMRAPLIALGVVGAVVRGGGGVDLERKTTFHPPITHGTRCFCG